MSITKKLLVSTSILASMLFLSACGGDEEAAPEAAVEPTAMAAPTEPAAAAGGEPMSVEGIEKAEGVVYQDEIYANWPYN